MKIIPMKTNQTVGIYRLYAREGKPMVHPELRKAIRLKARALVCVATSDQRLTESTKVLSAMKVRRKDPLRSMRKP